MPTTGKLSVILKQWYDDLKEIGEDLGFQDVWFGDQSLLPRTPCLVILGGESQRNLVTRPYGTDVTFEVYFMVYHGEVQSTEANVNASIELAETLEDYIHTRQYLGGLVTHGYVTRVEPGEVVKSNRVQRVTRLTWTATSRDNLPTNPT